MTGKAKLPSVDEVMGLGVSLGMSLTEAEAGAYQNLMTGAFKVYDWIERQEEFKPPVRYPRDKGYRPTRKENPYNAWFWKTEIRGAPSGPLAGLRVGVKDTICVAGVPMINGGRLLEGYVPDIDATVVSRLLDAGATIVGKTTVNDGAGDSLEGNSPLATRDRAQPEETDSRARRLFERQRVLPRSRQAKSTLRLEVIRAVRFGFRLRGVALLGSPTIFPPRSKASCCSANICDARRTAAITRWARTCAAACGRHTIRCSPSTTRSSCQRRRSGRRRFPPRTALSRLESPLPCR